MKNLIRRIKIWFRICPECGDFYFEGKCFGRCMDEKFVSIISEALYKLKKQMEVPDGNTKQSERKLSE